MSDSYIQTDVEKVVSGGFCVGCGGCASVDSGISMQLEETGVYRPIFSAITDAVVDQVCPFSNKGPHENELSHRYAELPYEAELGPYISLKAGYQKDDSARMASSSGGGATWILKKLFERGYIDRVIHVKETNDSAQFKYSVSESISEVEKGAKTRYYPIEISEVISFVLNNDGKYAFVGVPCFVKTIKRLCNVNEVINARIKFTAAIFCGHLKSAAFGESLAWQLGVKPDQIKKLDFRYKISTLPANDYGFEVVGQDNQTHISPMYKLLGKDWGMGAFRLKSCDFCDDIVGELADVSFGDGWLDKYKKDSKGTNLIIIRNEIIKELFEEGAVVNEFHLEDVSAAEIVQSQNASYRHRRNGVQHRVQTYEKSEKWYPKKRKFYGLSNSSFLDKLNWNYRSWYSKKTHEVFLKAKKKNDITIYTNFVKRYSFGAKVLRKFIGLYNRFK
ncbi:MAG: Coenzyme F420 hydrogenase/dehydrogenase, beta subunit C-terminal domain [Paraglaciecola chathamensis]